MKSYFKRIIVPILNFFIVFNFVLIVFYIITGGFTYSFLELFGTCIEIHNLSRPLAVFLLLICVKELFKKIYGIKEEKFLFEKPVYFFITALIVYIAFVIPAVLRRYYSFDLPHPQDLALYNQAIYNTVHGHPLAATCFGYIFHNWNLLADHLYLILLLIAPIYYFFQGPQTLLIIQSIVLALGAIPVYVIAKDKLKNEWAGFGISVIYLLYPLITKFYFSGFRTDYFAMVFLLCAFLSLEKRRINYLFIFVILAIVCKEDVFITTTLIGFYIIFFRRDVVRHIRIGLLIAFFSILYGLFAIKFIMPCMVRYAASGHCAYNAVQEVLPSLLTGFTETKNILFALSVFLNHIRALGYIALFSPFILLNMGVFAENIHFGYDYAVEVWHSALYVPILFIAFISGIKNLLKFINKYCASRFSVSGIKYMFWVWALGIPLTAGLINFNCNILQPFNESNNEKNCKPYIYYSFTKAATHVPENGSLVPQFYLLPYFSNRREFYLWLVSDCMLIHKGGPDYLFYSTKIPYSSNGEDRFFNNLLNSGRYEELYNSDSFVIMARKDKLDRKIKWMFDFSKKDFINNCEFNMYNTTYKLKRGIGGCRFSLYFDGDSSEDEFLQMRLGKVSPMEIEEDDYLEVDYKIENSEVQTIEIVLGVDINRDGEVDNYIARLYPESSRLGIFSKYRLDIYDFLKEKFPDRNTFSILEMEFYPHKMWCTDCSKKRIRGWYNFWVKDIKILNISIKDAK